MNGQQTGLPLKRNDKKGRKDKRKNDKKGMIKKEER